MNTQIFFDLFTAGFIIIVINNLFYLKSVREFFRYLKENHPKSSKALNQSIGEMMTSRSPKSMKVLWHYFKKEEYSSLNDEKLNKIGARARSLLLVDFVLFILLFVFFIANIITSFLLNS